MIGAVSLLNYPWKDIFTSMPVWAITCAHFCENWGFYTLLTQLPSYMNGKIVWKFYDCFLFFFFNSLFFFVDVLKFDIGKGSLLSALPYLVMSIVLQLTGFFVDWIRKNEILTTTQVRTSTPTCLFANSRITNWVHFKFTLPYLD